MKMVLLTDIGSKTQIAVNPANVFFVSSSDPNESANGSFTRLKSTHPDLKLSVAVTESFDEVVKRLNDAL